MDSLAQLLSRVRELNEQKKYQDVVGLLPQNILEQHNNDALYAEQAMAYYRLGKKNLSRKAAEIALSINPNNAKAYNYLANVVVGEGDLEKAKEYYLKAIKIDPKYSYSYIGLGTVFLGQKKYEKAKEYYLKAIKIDPKHPSPYNGMGNFFSEQKNYEKAKEYYLRAIEIDPDYDATYYNLGLLFYEQENYSEALPYYERYIKLTENRPDYYTELARSRVEEIKKILGSEYFEHVTEIVKEIKSLLLFNNPCITHYTGLSAAKALIMNNSPFRLSEGAYLNDTSEGRELFRFLGFSVENIQSNDFIARSFARKPFIGSFVAENKHDDLTLWRMYAKEAREEAQGCALTIKKDNLMEAIKRKLAPSVTSGSTASLEDDLNFYRVAYWEEEEKKFIIPGARADENKLNELMVNLKEEILKFSERKVKKEEDTQNMLEKLNTIAYLFKTAQYQYEHEVRLVVKEAIGFEFKIPEGDSPRVYIELDSIAAHLTKITIGPKVSGKDEWAAAFYYKLKTQGYEPAIVISSLPYK